MINILPVIHGASPRSGPIGAVLQEVLHPRAGHLLGQITGEPGSIQTALFDHFVWAVPLAVMDSAETEARDKGHLITCTQGIQRFY
jgi:hypothetical protein